MALGKFHSSKSAVLSVLPPSLSPSLPLFHQPFLCLTFLVHKHHCPARGRRRKECPALRHALTWKKLPPAFPELSLNPPKSKRRDYQRSISHFSQETEARSLPLAQSGTGKAGRRGMGEAFCQASPSLCLIHGKSWITPTLKPLGEDVIRVGGLRPPSSRSGVPRALSVSSLPSTNVHKEQRQGGTT